ncbi:MAG: TonB-dependent receptor [Calditrichaeota bacterium]|nr:MAG: TonB-dependent receptor [Calditrichota bacterium]
MNSQRGQFEAMVFYNWVRDLLVRRPALFNGLPYVIEEGDTLRVFRKENAGKAYTTGFAIDTEWLMGPGVAFFANLSATYGQDQFYGEPLSGIPPLNGIVGARWQRNRFWFEANMRFASAQTRLSSEDQADLRIPEGGTPGWSTLNLRAGWNATENFSLRLGLLNLLDTNYREHLSGFNAPGRNLYLGGEVKF